MCFGLIGVAVLADALVQPRGWRQLAGIWLHMLIILAAYGLLLALCGAPVVAAVATAALGVALAFVSNAKRAVLGEPLLFTDLVLIGAVFKHPQFYLSALSRWQLATLVLGAVVLMFLFSSQFGTAAAPHIVGLVLLGAAVALLMASLSLPPWHRLARKADAEADVAALGLLATLLLHWWRWRATPSSPVCVAGVPAPPSVELAVLVQCESFADPADLFADPTLHLPALAAARQAAWMQGRLLVSGFGAYTMRTEYGVIFGRSESELGYRRFDPYLTAIHDAGHALPARLNCAGWHSLFLHPHDMRFYGRNRILPAAGFAELVGPEAFASPSEGRYVTDDAIVDVIMARAAAARTPTLIHAVTIENHGPWPADRAGARGRQSSSYLKLVARGDAMLARLMREIAELRRPAVLLFYGDHRPSIPGAVEPGGDRHTPFVLLRFGADGEPICGTANSTDQTPAELHHALIAAITA
jgi:hypothetical protein